MEKEAIQVYADAELKRRVEEAAAKYNIPVEDYLLTRLNKSWRKMPRKEMQVPKVPLNQKGLLLNSWMRYANYARESWLNGVVNLLKLIFLNYCVANVMMNSPVCVDASIIVWSLVPFPLSEAAETLLERWQIQRLFDCADTFGV